MTVKILGGSFKKSFLLLSVLFVVLPIIMRSDRAVNAKKSSVGLRGEEGKKKV